MQMIMNILIIFCCVICGIYCQEEKPQNVTVSETSLFVLLGDDADTVTCSADCSPPCTFQWDTEPVTDGPNLTITNAQKSDTREYTCTASNSVDDDFAVFNLTVLYGPENVTVSLPDVDVLIGSNSEPVICFADCSPPCMFQWDTQPVTQGDTLQIINAQKNDTGVYNCVASNNIGNGTASVDVTVVYKPEHVIVSHSSLEVELGKDTTPVTCVADCSPGCTFQWDTDPVTLGDSLTITEAKRSDTRQHTCTAANYIDEGTASFNLTVVYGPQDVSVSESTLDVLLGEDSDTVTCSADCNPRCYFQWDTYPITHGANLTITDAKKSDDREYICTASNEIFDAVRKDYANLKLNVVYGPLSILFNTSQNISLNRAESIIVSCDADCNPSCTYQWDEGGNVLNISKAGQTDIGIHTCTANNVHGDDYKTVTVHVYGIPDIPSNLKVSSKTAKSLNVTWDTGWDGGFTQEYSISVTTGADNFTKIDPSLGEYVMQDLIPDSLYTIKLFATNARGNSSITSKEENTKALPSAKGLFKVTARDTYANVLLTFGNADSVTSVNISCCIYGHNDTSSCNVVREPTQGLSHLSVNVTYPKGGNGVYGVIAKMFDECILVQELKYEDPVRVDSDIDESGNNAALISVSVFMFIFAAVAIVLGLLLFREKRNKSEHQGDHVHLNAGHPNSSDYEINTTQNEADKAKSHTNSLEGTQPSYYNVHKGVKTKTKATPNAYTTDPGRPSVKPSYYNINRANNADPEYVTAEEHQSQRTEIKSSFLPPQISNASEYDNLKFMGDVENFATLEPSSNPMGSTSVAKSENPVPNPKPKIYIKPTKAQERNHDYEQLNKDDKDSTPGIYTGV